MPISVVEPVLTSQQLFESDARYVIGTGPIARFAVSLLQESARKKIVFVDQVPFPLFDGRPIIDIRRFLATVAPTAPVIFASHDKSLLSSLVAMGQRAILDVCDHFASEQFLVNRAVDASASKIAVLSTIPRSGTYSLKLFLYALNELLRHPDRAPSAQQLFLYEMANWTNAQSRYRPTRVLDFLGIDDIRIGHHVPPGSMAGMGRNPVAAKMFVERASRYKIACRQVPALAALSHPVRPLQFEPVLSMDRPSSVRYAFIFRDIVDQIVSMLSIYEMVVPYLLRQGADRWSVDRLIGACRGYFRPFVFFLLDGMLPLIFHQALASRKALVDIVIDDGHLRSLVVDYALQTYSSEWSQASPHPGLKTANFAFEAMRADRVSFFEGLTTFLRGSTLNSEESALVASASRLTDGAAVRAMERELGHSVSYNDGISGLFETTSHMTSGGEADPTIKAAGERVSQRIRPQEAHIRSTFAAAIAELRAGFNAGLNRTMH